MESETYNFPILRLFPTPATKRSRNPNNYFSVRCTLDIPEISFTRVAEAMLPVPIRPNLQTPL
jgi:hypothetical protein